MEQGSCNANERSPFLKEKGQSSVEEGTHTKVADLAPIDQNTQLGRDRLLQGDCGNSTSQNSPSG